MPRLRWSQDARHDTPRAIRNAIGILKRRRNKVSYLKLYIHLLISDATNRFPKIIDRIARLTGFNCAAARRVEIAAPAHHAAAWQWRR